MLPRIFAPDLSTATADVTLRADEAHHLVRVRRLGVGQRVRLFDGAGGEWEGRLTIATRDRAIVTIDRQVEPAAEPPVRVTLVIGLLKGDQMDTVVRDATALGVAAIAPLASAHVAVPARAWRDDAARDRWTRIAIAAAKQSGRAVVPQIGAVRSLDAILDLDPGAAVLVAVEPAASGLPPMSIETAPAAALALVGPEGGWSANEIAALAARGACAVSLGPRTLRAELAPAVLLSALWTRWGW